MNVKNLKNVEIMFGSDSKVSNFEGSSLGENHSYLKMSVSYDINGESSDAICYFVE